MILPFQTSSVQNQILYSLFTSSYMVSKYFYSVLTFLTFFSIFAGAGGDSHDTHSYCKTNTGEKPAHFLVWHTLGALETPPKGSRATLACLYSRRFPSSLVLKCWLELQHFLIASYLPCIIGTFWMSKRPWIPNHFKVLWATSTIQEFYNGTFRGYRLAKP